MPNPSIILEGRKIDVRKEEDMYTTTINGLIFSGKTFKDLASIIGNFYSIQLVYDYTLPSVSLVDKLKGLLLTSSLLTDRQKALRQLESLSDPEAIRLVNNIKSKPVSYGADYITKSLNKKHFSEVTSTEISSIVSNIVHRSDLLKELYELMRLDA
jgi:hypothetical protein